MECNRMTVNVQPTYTVEQKVYINGYAPTDEDIAYSGKLTIYLTDEVADDATNKPTT